MDILKIVNKRIPNIDGKRVVTGQARYTRDVKLPGMLVGGILRSPHPHAEILSINTERAKMLPGVFAIVTAADTPLKPYIYLGGTHSDRLPLAHKRVRFIGEEIAAVAAVDARTVEKALELIEVSYKPLPFVLDPEEAMGPNAPLLHENKERNISAYGSRIFGDPQKAFAEAAVVVEGSYETQAVQHCCMEPFTCIAQFSTDGQIDLWASTQAPFYVQKEVAHVLDLSPNDIRVHEVRVGGGFGGRSKVAELEAITTLLAMKCPGRPVKIALTRKDEFETRTVKVPMKIKLRTAADREGRLLARWISIISDNGAYNHCAPSVSAVGATMSYVMYRVQNVYAEHYTVYTNKQTTAQMRGYGEPDTVFAIEAQMDEIAGKLGMDPYEVRMINAIDPDETLINGWKITSCGMKESLQRVAEAIRWDEKKRAKVPGKGVGIACSIHGTGGRWYPDGDYSSSNVKVGHDGVVIVETGAVDIGQGIRTTLAMVAAETLGVDIEQVRVISMDTATTPSDMGAFASKTAFLGGNAVRDASLDAKGQITKYAAEILQVPQEELEIKDGYVWISAPLPERCAPIGDFVLDNPSRIGRHIVGKAFWESKTTENFNRTTGYGNTCETYAFSAHVAEVEVDEETGHVKVKKIVAAHDVGLALNPTIVEGQIEGSIAQGIGFTLMENHTWDQQGRVEATDFKSYRIPSIGDVPKMETILIEPIDPAGPYGAKGVGEPALVATPAAIANAIYDAIGIRMTSLPITPEKLHKAIKQNRIQQDTTPDHP
ncbi:MAG: xanthine dehydrogenase family protein molybdopterin-binding subunit [Anaerolineaceae bacterium]|nr:xanthine dehydrogenase family protein molybdopterin-binding subunit [Anaerolineaceae bacterium]